VADRFIQGLVVLWLGNLDGWAKQNTRAVLPVR
jgi:hypothetical protein